METKLNFILLQRSNEANNNAKIKEFLPKICAMSTQTKTHLKLQDNKKSKSKGQLWMDKQL